MQSGTVPKNNQTLLSTFAGPFIAIKEYFTGWQGCANFFDFLGHVANLIGVGSHAIISWVPILKDVIEMLGVADPLIYCFRAAEKIVRYVGRNYFSAKFEEEKYGFHPWQNAADIGITLLFAAAITLFFAGSFPFHLSLAWFLGLAGVSINGYFDHRCPEIFAKKKYDSDESHNDEVFTDYLKKYYSTRLYFALIFSLALLLILGSATGLGLPLALNLGFALVAKLGSLSVILCNFARPINNYSPEILYNIHQKIHKVFPCCLEPPKNKSAPSNNTTPPVAVAGFISKGKGTSTKYLNQCLHSKEFIPKKEVLLNDNNSCFLQLFQSYFCPIDAEENTHDCLDRVRMALMARTSWYS